MLIRVSVRPTLPLYTAMQTVQNGAAERSVIPPSEKDEHSQSIANTLAADIENLANALTSVMRASHADNLTYGKCSQIANWTNSLRLSLVSTTKPLCKLSHPSSWVS